MRRILIAVVCSSVLSVLAVLAWSALSQDVLPAAEGDSILTIPASAFDEYVDGYDFVRGPHLYFDTGSGYFYAPINLPNGSVIKKAILICKDNGNMNVELLLLRVTQSGSTELLANVLSSGNVTGCRIFSKTLTTNKYVNTWKHSHYVRVYLPGTTTDGYKFSQAKIVYTPSP